MCVAVVRRRGVVDVGVEAGEFGAEEGFVDEVGVCGAG